MTKTPHVTIRLTAEDRRGLALLAHREGDVAFAAIIRKLIRQAVRELEGDTP